MAASAIVLFGVAEFIGRTVYGFDRPPLYQTDPEIEYMLQPSQSSVVKRTAFTTNRFGMRSPEWSEHKQSPSSRRVLAFGDSVMMAGAVPQDQIATSLIRNALAERGVPTEVGNVSAASWGPGNWLAYAKRYGFFDADTVVLVISSHDYADNPTFRPLNRLTHPTKRPIFATAQYIRNKVNQFSDWVGLAQEPHDPGPTEKDSRLALGDLRRFLLLAKQGGRKVLVFQHFERVELDGKPKPGAARIAALCRDLQIETISMRGVEAANQAGSYADGIHLTAQGQAVIAAEIARHL